MALTALDLASAHVVGQPMKILGSVTTAVVECQCEQGGVIMLAGKGKVGTCKHCQKQYVIADASVVVAQVKDTNLVTS